ncbi:coronin-7 isoform X11 [Sitodiplosis mosellana]|uniref:coronin-7 isoform X11 n=1 Tax=Sitodiplosis mosellana TaxID=263140 RepID=UPI0024440304|nr:coronin-7 isoform X11 [Sitodiplosis mosellana]
MAWRFKASKYKNAAPIVPKPEVCIRDIVVGSYQTYGNNIAASAAFMAFNWEHAGSSLAVLPLDDCGRKSKNMPLLHGHTDTVTDLHFSPFHDGLLATGSQDCLVKIWHIPEKGLEQSLTTPECQFTHKQRRVETVGFHPTADYLLHSTAAGNINLWDLTSQKEVFGSNEHPDVIQSLNWKLDGTLMTTSCKDKMVRIIDPRSNVPITLAADSHQSIKDSRVVWLGDQSRILTTGFDSARLRQIIIRDLRNFNTPEKTLELDCSTGVLMPLYDPDTNMLFLAGKGDTTIAYMEVTDKDPYLIEGLRHNGEQTKGACLVPKRALRVMEGEVNRIMQLTSNSVIPIMYQVPRKTYRDFHSDLYPETNGYKTDLTVTQWLKGVNTPVSKMSLDPAKRELGDAPIIPRLGPKPFSVGSGDVNFDKVFSVPQAPGSERNSTSSNHNEAISTTDNQNKSTESSDNSIDEQKDSDEKEDAIVYRNGSNGHSMHKSDSLEEDLQRAISTAERRKIFENARSESEIASHDSTDAEELRRLTLNRSSIAERRRLYEARSVSTNNAEDKPPQSPLPVLRKDSTKTRSASPNKAQIEIEERRKTSPIPINESNGKHEDKTDAIFRKPNPVNNGNHGANNKTKPAEITTATKRTSTVFGKVSKFRHLKGTPTHKSTHIENIRNISRQIPGECNGFHANYKRVAVPLSGPGGKIAVYELNKPGRLPDGVIPSLVNGNSIMDFQWDPFDANKLAVACDDGVVRLWKVPDNGLTEPTNQPEGELVAHSDKIYFIRFHPLAKDVLLTASYDMTIKIWNLATFSEELCLKGHTDQIFDCAWSPCGVFAATVCKDGKIRIFNPRKSENPIREGPGPIGTRGARITWAIDGHYIVCTGFDKVSERQISIYKATDLSAPINTVGLDVSPAILIPFYDEDSSTLLLTGKGDSTIYAFEITDEAPHICPLSHHRCATSHQGLSFLTKNHCDVSAVEFAKAFRLTNNTIEPLSFTVPRIKNELFQDDLFPPTRVTWIPTLSPADWFNCRDKKVKKISLQPEGMECLSSTLPVTQQPPLTPNKKTDQHSPPSNILQSYNRQINTDNDKYKQEEVNIGIFLRFQGDFFCLFIQFLTTLLVLNSLSFFLSFSIPIFSKLNNEIQFSMSFISDSKVSKRTYGVHNVIGTR